MSDAAVVCRACGSAQLYDLGECAKVPDGLLTELGATDLKPGRLMRCQRCGLGQRMPCPDNERLAQIYRQTPTGTMEYDFENNAAWVGAREQLVALWSAHAEITVLDIGCHEGRFLKALPEGWRCYGVEGGEAPAKVARQCGVTVIADRLQTIQPQWQQYFHAVTLFDVLEHLPDPAEGLRQAAALVKPGGMLIVSTGDLDAWTWQWFKGDHWYLQTPLHLSFASRQFFDYVARQYALKLVDYRPIPHQFGESWLHWQDRVEAIYFGARQRGGLWRVPQRLIQMLPGWQHLRHRTHVPWTFRLRDHLLVTYKI